MSLSQEQLKELKKKDTIQLDTEITRATHGIKQLENELADLERELDERKKRLDDLLKNIERIDKQ